MTFPVQEDYVKKVACVGGGAWGKNLIRVFQTLGRLGAVCDSNPDAAGLQNLPSQMPQSLFYGEILSNPDIDAIVLATPAGTHFELAKLALEAEKNLFVEKPLALSFEEGRRLVNLADSRGLILMTGHLMLYHPALHRLKQMLASGDTGPVRYMTSRRINWGRVRRDENVLWSFGPHDVSMLLHLTDELPFEVLAFGQTLIEKPGNGEDVCHLNLRWENGTFANVMLSWLSPRKERELSIVCEKKTILFDDLEPTEKIRIYNARPAAALDYSSYGEALSLPMAEVFSPALDPTEPLVLECRHFLDCIDGKTKPLTGGQSALNTLLVLEAANASMKSGGKPFPIKTNNHV